MHSGKAERPRSLSPRGPHHTTHSTQHQVWERQDSLPKVTPQARHPGGPKLGWATGSWPAPSPPQAAPNAALALPQNPQQPPVCRSLGPEVPVSRHARATSWTDRDLSVGGGGGERQDMGDTLLPFPTQVPLGPGRRRVKGRMEGFASYFVAFPVCQAPFDFNSQRTPQWKSHAVRIVQTRKLRHRKAKSLPLVTQGCALSPGSVCYVWSLCSKGQRTTLGLRPLGYRHRGPSGEDQEL